MHLSCTFSTFGITFSEKSISNLGCFEMVLRWPNFLLIPVFPLCSYEVKCAEIISIALQVVIIVCECPVPYMRIQIL